MIVKVVLLCIFHYFISKFIQHILNYAFNVHIVRECQYLLWRRPSLPLSALLLCRLDMLRRLCLCLCLAPALHSPHLVPSNTCTCPRPPCTGHPDSFDRHWVSTVLQRIWGRQASEWTARRIEIEGPGSTDLRGDDDLATGSFISAAAWAGSHSLALHSRPADRTLRLLMPHHVPIAGPAVCVLSWRRDVNSGEKTIDPSILEQLSNF